MKRLALLLLLLLAPGVARADDGNLYQELRWRPIGPLRGGRTKAAAGVPGRPGTFHIGVCNGGVWRTTDYGRTWEPIFDDQPTGSIGALAVAATNPDIIYVGSGEGLQRPDLSTGDGLYKSIDGGKSWRHLGLRDAQQITQIALDPRDPQRLFVAVLGHPYGPSEERGIFRSRDGGATFEKVLYRDPDTGGADVVLDPRDPQVVYASLWESRQAPWENGAFTGPGSGLYKSSDGGTTWRRLEKGLPTFEKDGLGRIGITVAPSDPRRLFATVELKGDGWLYRSDDAGESWARISDDERVVERASDFAEVKVHPQNPDIVFTASVVAWKSVDGGKTFTAFRGAPGGDDYHRFWIDPTRPDVMLLASDQGAIITVNGGRTWSSWYNQPTAQMFHVSTDNAFPYRVCGGQQESGSACVSSRSGDGAITFRDWRPVGVEEYGYAVPDPLDPEVVYGGKLSRTDRRTGQTVETAPRLSTSPTYRTIRTQPVVFSPLDPRTLYFGSSSLWKTTDGGRSWLPLSGDLTREARWEAPASVGKYRGSDEAKATARGVIYAVAPSYVARRTLWVGSDDGRVHVTTDEGKSWTDVTPPALGPWAKVSIIDAGRFDAATAYVAVNTLRLDDLRPHIYRTHDGGKSWTEITRGLPDGGIVNVVREDPVRRGLLYAGTEQAVYVSFDDGDSWRSLRNNMPATSIRDLVVKDEDVVVATHGRGFWILDDVTPLRQTAAGDAFLFAPAPAWRARYAGYTDTPLPPDEPMMPNRPEGAFLDYQLAAPAREVTLEVFDAAGRPVRRFSSGDPVTPPTDEGNTPRWWIRPRRAPPVAAGLHRVLWDLREKTPPALRFGYPISAIPGDTPPEPRGPWALPGRYLVRLTVDGAARTQPLTVRMDPRVKTPPAGLAQQHALALKMVDGMRRGMDALTELRALRVEGDLKQKLAELEGDPDPGFLAARRAPPSLSQVVLRLGRRLEELNGYDAAPLPQLGVVVAEDLKQLDTLLATWRELRGRARGLSSPP